MDLKDELKEYCKGYISVIITQAVHQYTLQEIRASFLHAVQDTDSLLKEFEKTDQITQLHWSYAPGQERTSRSKVLEKLLEIQQIIVSVQKTLSSISSEPVNDLGASWDQDDRNSDNSSTMWCRNLKLSYLFCACWKQ